MIDLILLSMILAQDDPKRPSVLLVQVDAKYLAVDPARTVKPDEGPTFKLTSVEGGVLFDINGDGVLDQVAWTAEGEELAFLAYDRDGDGRITSGKELFGDSTVPGKRNGFSALTALSGPISAQVDDDNPFFSRLLLWTDKNHNGVSEPDELRPFGDLFYAVGLGFTKHNRKDGNGNEFRYRGWALAKGGQPLNPRTAGPNEFREHQRDIYDVMFVAR